MIKENILNALNKQINKEFYSAYLYLSMSAYAESLGLKGFAQWFKVQSQEELDHAMKIYSYVIERGGRVKLYAIEKPKNDWMSIIEVFEDGYKHEQLMTESINNLMDLAVSEKDYATVNFLQWFVNEQVEEEASFSEILDKLKLIGDDKRGLFMLDKDLGQRVYTSPITEKI
ncbi:putative bacterial non-heme ferritin-like protein [Methanocaldococcus lauensis]|uniref:Putative bacterial non-heme ferritin-like protein n=1 Tax=Methanocaldococcus lauensis TaxID=2546128 RepID=A0A8D6PTT4_9EURY|nr:ferritin [Methanocaldococcus lauensis]CAB3287463.1 putative bacterial non-heme ferritin-like protein [Methanocaldococcus lauensis]CAB3290012.1 putative bacterial non-heme ferritin-like protein [Methanocaldococcus lauensis]